MEWLSQTKNILRWSGILIILSISIQHGQGYLTEVPNDPYFLSSCLSGPDVETWVYQYPCDPDSNYLCSCDWERIMQVCTSYGVDNVPLDCPPPTDTYCNCLPAGFEFVYGKKNYSAVKKN